MILADFSLGLAMVIVIPNDWVQLLAIGNPVQTSNAIDTERKDRENLRKRKMLERNRSYT